LSELGGGGDENTLAKTDVTWISTLVTHGKCAGVEKEIRSRASRH